MRLLLPRGGGGRGLGGLKPLVAAALAVAILTGCGDDGGKKQDTAKTPTPTATPTPAETRSPAVAEGKARGDLAIGITEQNPNFFWAPGAREGVAPEFVRWQDDMGKLKPSFYRLVLDWPSLQPDPNQPADLAHPYDGCLRGTPPCAGWAGVKDQLAALASRQKQHKGGWQVLAVITGTPDWAARPASGCERSGTQPRSRAPKASAMGAYRKLVTDVAALGDEVGVELRYWSAWNEPNHPFFISPQRATCSTSAKSLAAVRYTEMVRNLKRALDRRARRPGVRAGRARRASTRARRRAPRSASSCASLPNSVVCGSTILSQHGYITGINPVDDAAKGAAAHKCKKKHVVWMTETGVGAPHAGEDKRTSAPAERKACKQLHRRLVQWYDDPRVTAAFQYTFREDDVFRTGLITTDLARAFPVLKEWQAWGGTARPKPTDPPPSRARCGSS